MRIKTKEEIMKIIKDCDILDVYDYGFEIKDFADGYVSAWFNIFEDVSGTFFLRVKDNGRVHIENERDQKQFAVTNIEDVSNWRDLADEIFNEKYLAEIERAKFKKENKSWKYY